MRIDRLEHVQLAMPPGGEALARAFYGGVLEIPEVPKPPHLAKRGGCWFERGELKIHLGIESEFRPARKAHPALLVVDLQVLVGRLKSVGHDVREGEPLEGYHNVYVDDPFGNRIELMEPTGSQRPTLDASAGADIDALTTNPCKAVSHSELIEVSPSARLSP